MNNESQNATSLLTINTTINTSKNTKTLNLKPVKKPTLDIFGEIIKKGGKQKISFKDNILLCDNESNDDSECLSENKAIKKDKNFVEIIDVISYKEQNKQMFFKGNGEIPNDEVVCCESCEIF